MAARVHFVKIIREVAEELGISLTGFSGDWAFMLEKDGVKAHIVGYHFPLNLSSAKELCQDKSLTYDVLKDAGIPAVPHLFVPGPRAGGSGDLSCFRPLLENWITERGYAVVKDNYGTGGNQVFRFTDVPEAEEAIRAIHERSAAACICPYYEIAEEYRVTMLDGEALQVIRKERESRVNALGEKEYLNWRHNLGQGATGIPVTDPGILEKTEPIAKAVMRAMNLRFASVDIVESKEGFTVLEVNAGVMMEHFAGQSPECYEKAKRIYRMAIRKAMGME